MKLTEIPFDNILIGSRVKSKINGLGTIGGKYKKGSVSSRFDEDDMLTIVWDNHKVSYMAWFKSHNHVELL